MGWLTGWTYRKTITLSRPLGAVANYQMKLLVGESSGAVGYDVHCVGHCLSTFDDLRFTTSDGTTLLDYWIESLTGTTPNQLATIWVEYDLIGTGDTTFYMYYGNASATAVSNGPNTFIFFDDFLGGSLDTDKWTLSQDTGTSISFDTSVVILSGGWAPPNFDALWAWFKHNEGSGTNIVDYSPVETDGTLVAINDPLAIDYFWNTIPGFGTAGMGAHAEYQAYVGRTSPSRNSAYCSLVAFIKPWGNGQFNAYAAIQLGHTGLLNSLDVGWEGMVTLPPTPHYWRLGANGQSAFSAEIAVYGTWYCVYAYSQAGVNNNGLYIRKSGDVDWTLAVQNIGITAGAGTDQTSVFAFGVVSDCTQVTEGDCLYYADPTSDGMITLVQATDIFDNLKARYGMT
jgi:hypothetical protein